MERQGGRESRKRLRAILLAQAAYYVTTGIWPFASLRTFLRVTGRKTDIWLVRMVGALAAVNGAMLALLIARRRECAEGATLAVLSALAFGAVETSYALRGTIGRIYLADAAVEAAFLWNAASYYRAARR